MARFRLFSPTPAAPPHTIERPPKWPQPPHTLQLTMSPHYPRMPFPTAHLKLSPSSSVFWTFSPKPAVPPHTIEWPPKWPQPPHTLRLTMSPHHSQMPFPTAHLKPSPSGSVSDFQPQTRCTAPCYLTPSNGHPNGRNYRTPCGSPHSPIISECRFQRCTRNRALVAQFRTFSPKMTPPSYAPCQHH